MMDLIKTVLAFVCAAALIQGTWCQCNSRNYAKCLGSDKCFYRTSLCDGYKECADNTDERFCYRDSIAKEGGCPADWWMCESRSMCIPKQWKCDNYPDCSDESDERICVYKGKKLLSEWLLGKWTEIVNSRGQYSSSDLYRLVVALHLLGSDVLPQPKQAMAEKLELQILTEMATGPRLNYDELALSIHALLVTCHDPWDFHGYNLVSDLRGWTGEKELRPFDLLALCNAGDAPTPQDDAQKAADAFYSKDRAFTTDNKAMALQALACIQSRTNTTLSGINVTAMEHELKQGQFENGTVGNFRTTALVLQALLSTQSINQSDFSYGAAMNAILEGQSKDGSWGSLADSYYMAPVLNGASLANVSNGHCTEKNGTPSVLQYRTKVPRDNVHYSIRVDGQKTKTWDLYVPTNSSLYDVIEIVNLLDPAQKVTYNVANGKPYVSSLYGVQEDLEKEIYWTIYRQRGYEGRWFSNESPVDITVVPDIEYSLWYKARE